MPAWTCDMQNHCVDGKYMKYMKIKAQRDDPNSVGTMTSPQSTEFKLKTSFSAVAFG